MLQSKRACTPERFAALTTDFFNNIRGGIGPLVSVLTYSPAQHHRESQLGTSTQPTGLLTPEHFLESVPILPDDPEIYIELRVLDDQAKKVVHVADIKAILLPGSFSWLQLQWHGDELDVVKALWAELMSFLDSLGIAEMPFAQPEAVQSKARRHRDDTLCRDEFLKQLKDSRPDASQANLAILANDDIARKRKKGEEPDAAFDRAFTTDDVKNAWHRHPEWGEWLRAERSR